MRMPCLWIVGLMLFPSVLRAQGGEDQAGKLTAEITKLREENARLKLEIELLHAPQAKFELVLWYSGAEGNKGKLYLVVNAASAGELRNQMDFLEPYAAAALQEAAKAPVSDPLVILVLRRPAKGSSLLPHVPDLVAGFSVSALKAIAAAPPEKRGAMFLTSAWTMLADAVPKEAKPLARALNDEPSSQDDDKLQAAELKKFRGHWVVSSAKGDGQDRPEEMGTKLYISGDYARLHPAQRWWDSIFFELAIEAAGGESKQLHFRPLADDKEKSPATTPIELSGKAAYEIDGDTAKLRFNSANPKKVNSKVMVVWVLQRVTARYRKEKLDEGMRGKQLLPWDHVAKEGDKDNDWQFDETTYLGCRDVHQYFLEPYPRPDPPGFNRGPFPKFVKNLHGVRMVQDPQGQMVVVEGWYGGVKHGTQLRFEKGKLRYEETYEYGVRHGTFRIYHGNNRIWIEETWVDGQQVSKHWFHDNGQPSTFWIGEVLVDERDDKGRPILARKTAKEKLYGEWEIVAATLDGTTRAGELHALLTFAGDEVRVKLPGKKSTMTMNFFIRDINKHNKIDFTPIEYEKRLHCALDELPSGLYALDGDTMTLTLRERNDAPSDLGDKRQVRWILKKKQADAGKPENCKSDLDGRWEVVDVDARGAPTWEGEPGQIWTIAQRQISIRYVAKDKDKVQEFKEEWTFTCDPKKTPRSIDLSCTAGAKAGSAVLGIYERKVDRLRICFNSWKRPEDFTKPLIGPVQFSGVASGNPKRDLQWGRTVLLKRLPDEAVPKPSDKRQLGQSTEAKDVELILAWLRGAKDGSFEKEFGDSTLLMEAKNALLYTDISGVNATGLKIVPYDYVRARMERIRRGDKVGPAVLVTRSVGKDSEDEHLGCGEFSPRKNERFYYVEVAFGNRAWNYLKISIAEVDGKQQAVIICSAAS